MKPTPEQVAAVRSGTGEPHAPQQPRIADRCPACGGQSLFIGAGGWLTCSRLDCKHPAHEEALAALLATREAQGFAACKARALAIVVGYRHAGAAANIRALSAEGGAE